MSGTKSYPVAKAVGIGGVTILALGLLAVVGLGVAADHWIFHPLVGRGYQFWSGLGSDLSEITLIGIGIGAWRHVNCHAPWCPRLGRHRTADGQFRLCRKHHPDLPDHALSLAELHERHEAAKPDQGG